jgi:hypothetical protein
LSAARYTSHQIDFRVVVSKSDCLLLGLNKLNVGKPNGLS